MCLQSTVSNPLVRGERYWGKLNSLGNFEFGITLKKPKYNRISESGIEFESHRIKHQKSAAFTLQFLTLGMPAFFPVKERVQESDMCFSNLVQQDAPTARNKSILIPKLGLLEEWLYVLTVDAEGNGSHWEVLDCLGHKHHQLRPMPGPAKAGLAWSFSMGSFWLLLVIWWLMAPAQSEQIYSNTILASIGGCGADGESLSGAKVYDPESDKWTVIESLRRPRWAVLHVASKESSMLWVGGQVSQSETPAHAVLGKKLCCMKWKNERKLAIFNPEDNSWKMVPVPVTGSSSISFRFGILDGKLLVFSLQEDPAYHTLLYDPHAAPGSEWQTSEIKPSGLCLCTVTIKA
ncbi:UNVERIFIED_CONTAM: F-box/kelch-repeat protein [Sesamum angustifolium]|uniref:F-box/kelch-repeat protein n=1 Tax=Sesamum angustifolium TaxID=2727405 RepID=A0AAW2MA64_9LAMI